MARSLTLLAVVWVVVLVFMQAATAMKIEYNNFRMVPYTKGTGLRLPPYSRVGIYGPDTIQVQATNRNAQAKVKVSLTVSNAPSYAFEVVVYNAVYLETTAWTDRPKVDACYDFGQDSGVYIPSNMTRYMVTLKGSHFSANGTPTDDFVVDQEVLLMSTGLYVVQLDFCRFVYQDTKTGEYYDTPPFGASVKRVLDTRNWDKAVINGYIDFLNPYGYLPGQAYGALPFYCIAWLATLFLLIALIIGALRLGYMKVLAYQWLIMQMSLFCMIAYMFLVIYFGHLNETDINARGFFVFAEVFLIIRATYCRFAVFMVSWGYQVYKPTMPTKMIAGVFVGTFIYFIVNLAFLIASESSGNNSAADHAHIVMASEMGMAQGLQFGVFVMEVLTGIAIFWALRASMQETANDANRHRMFRQMGIVLTIYAIIGFIWFVYSTFAPWGAGTLNEANWESWWLNAAFWDLLFMLVLFGVSIIWFPSVATLSHLSTPGAYTDTTVYDGATAGGARIPMPGAGSFQPLGGPAGSSGPKQISYPSVRPTADRPENDDREMDTQQRPATEPRAYSSGLPA